MPWPASQSERWRTAVGKAAGVGIPTGLLTAADYDHSCMSELQSVGRRDNTDIRCSPSCERCCIPRADMRCCHQWQASRALLRLLSVRVKLEESESEQCVGYWALANVDGCVRSEPFASPSFDDAAHGWLCRVTFCPTTRVSAFSATPVTRVETQRTLGFPLKQTEKICLDAKFNRLCYMTGSESELRASGGVNCLARRGLGLRPLTNYVSNFLVESEGYAGCC